MKIANVKTKVAKFITVGLLAGAFAIAAPSKAQAQVAVRIGPAPRFYGPVYRRPIVVAPPVVGFGFYGRPYGWDHREVFFHDRHFYR
jgi:hypothetical protein